MDSCVFRAFTNIGLNDHTADVVIKALENEMDRRTECSTNMGTSALRHDIATLSGDMSSKIATLTGEIKRLDEKIHSVDGKIDGVRNQVDRSIAHVHWAVGFMLLVCSLAGTYVWRVAG